MITRFLIYCTKKNNTVSALLIVLALLMGSWLILFGPVVRAANSPLDGKITVQSTNITADFPSSLEFDLIAKIAIDAPTIKQVSLNYQLIGNYATSVRPATITDTNYIMNGQVKIDTKRYYIPPGTRISYYWEFTDSAGDVYDTEPQQTNYQDERFDFEEVSGGVVTVRWYEGSQAFGQLMLSTAQDTINRLSKQYGIPAPTTPINITIYPDTTSMFTALPSNTAEWVGGQAVPTLGTIVLAIPPGDNTEVRRSIPHEVTHQVNYQATKNPYNYLPKWLDEGLAVNNQAQVDAFLTQSFERALDTDQLIPLRVLNGDFPPDTQQSYLAYGESVNVVQYILKKYGSAGITKIFAAFKAGASYDDAIRQGLGISLDELDREWRKSLGYPVGPAINATSTPLVNITPMALPTETPTDTPPLNTPTPTLVSTQTSSPTTSNTAKISVTGNVTQPVTQITSQSTAKATLTVTTLATTASNKGGAVTVPPTRNSSNVAWLVVAGVALVVGMGLLIVALRGLFRSNNNY